MKTMKRFATLFTLLVMLLALSVPALAANEETIAPETAVEESSETAVKSSKAMASAVMIGIACLGGALAMGIAVGKAGESIARQPEAAGQIRTSMMMGLVFIETVIIYALIVAILIIFVL